MTATAPDVSQLDAEQLLALRTAVDARLAEVRADFMQKAEALGLAIVESESKKTRKRRSTARKENE